MDSFIMLILNRTGKGTGKNQYELDEVVGEV